MDLRSRLRALEARLGVGQSAAAPANPAPPAAPANPAAGLPLHERLQRLGGAPRGPRARTADAVELGPLLGGQWCAEHVLLIERVLPLTHRHGCVPLQRINETALDFIAGGSEPRREDLLFVDTETTGLAGGTGTVAFVLGLARLRSDAVEVRQYFLSAFSGERAMLEHALAWIADSAHLVSFNGKSFDVPLLATRYVLALRRNPLAGLPHIDLLHRTRAAFKRNWPDCRLQTAEQHLLRLFRDDDVPGHLIPQIWTDWLQCRQAGPLRQVVDHNRLDVLTLIALAGILGGAYAQPGHPDADPLGIARAHVKAGDIANALRHLTGHHGPMTDAARLELASLHARAAEWDKAVPLWEQLAERKVFCAMESLAKYHEHRQRDFATALQWTARMESLADDHTNASIDRRRSRLLRRSCATAPGRA